MYKNEDYLKLSPENFIHYLRTKHKKYVDELPEQLEKWIEKNKQKPTLESTPKSPEVYTKDWIEDLVPKKEDFSKKLNNGVVLNRNGEEKKLDDSLERLLITDLYLVPDNTQQKLELATKILCSMNTGLATAESVVDHAWEMAELLIKKSRE